MFKKLFAITNLRIQIIFNLTKIKFFIIKIICFRLKKKANLIFLPHLIIVKSIVHFVFFYVMKEKTKT